MPKSSYNKSTLNLPAFLNVFISPFIIFCIISYLCLNVSRISVKGYSFVQNHTKMLFSKFVELTEISLFLIAYVYLLLYMFFGLQLQEVLYTVGVFCFWCTLFLKAIIIQNVALSN